MLNFLSLFPNLFRNPRETWSIATNGERVALFLVAAMTVADIIRFSLLDVGLDVAVLVLIYLYIWDQVDFDLIDDE